MLRHTVLPSTIEAAAILYPRRSLQQGILGSVQAWSSTGTILAGSRHLMAAPQYDSSQSDNIDLLCIRPPKAGRIHAHLTSSCDILQNELLEGATSDLIDVSPRYRKLRPDGGPEPLVVCQEDIKPINIHREESEALQIQAREWPFAHFVVVRQDTPLSTVLSMLQSVLADALDEESAAQLVSTAAVNFVPESYAGGVTQRLSVSVGGGVRASAIIQAIVNGVNVLPYPIKLTYLGLSKSPCAIALRTVNALSDRRKADEVGERWCPLTSDAAGLFGAETSNARVLHTLRLRGLHGNAAELEKKLRRSLTAPFLNTFSEALYSSRSMASLAFVGDLVSTSNAGCALLSLAQEHLSLVGDEGMAGNSLRHAFGKYKNIRAGGIQFQADSVAALHGACSSSLLGYIPALAAVQAPSQVEVELLADHLEGGGSPPRPRHQRRRDARRRDDDAEDDFDVERARRLASFNDRYASVLEAHIPPHTSVRSSVVQARLFLAWNMLAAGILTSLKAEDISLDAGTPTPGLPAWIGARHALQRIPQVHPAVLSPMRELGEDQTITAAPLTPSHTRKVEISDNSATISTALLPVGQLPKSLARVTSESTHLTNMGLAAGCFHSGDTQFRCWRPLVMEGESVDAWVGVLGDGGVAQDLFLSRKALRACREVSGSRTIPSLVVPRIDAAGRHFVREKGIQSAVVSAVLPAGSSLAALLREGFRIESDVPAMSEGPFSKSTLQANTGRVDYRRDGGDRLPVDPLVRTSNAIALDKDDVMVTGNLLRAPTSGYKGASLSRRRFDEDETSNE